jgi:hypothetical protein
VGHVPRRKVLAGNLKGRDDHLCVGIDGRLVIRWILEFQSVTGFMWLRIESSGRFF